MPVDIHKEAIDKQAANLERAVALDMWGRDESLQFLGAEVIFYGHVSTVRFDFDLRLDSAKTLTECPRNHDILLFCVDWVVEDIVRQALGFSGEIVHVQKQQFPESEHCSFYVVTEIKFSIDED